jgi:hypothetical protein
MAKCDCGRTHRTRRITTQCQQCGATIQPIDDTERLKYFQNSLIEVIGAMKVLDGVKIQWSTIGKLDKYRNNTHTILNLIGDELRRGKDDD